MTRVAVFTDNDFDKTNGVTTVLKALLRYAPASIQPRVFTCSDLPVDEPDYLAMRSAGMRIPYYPDMRMYLPRIRGLHRALVADGVHVLHLTTPGPVGLAARQLASFTGLQLVGSFHTRLAEYTTILSGSPRLGRAMGAYMRWLYGRCATVMVPSADTKRQLEAAGWDPARLLVWPRGVDTNLFMPFRRSAALRERWRVSDRRPAVLYAGRLSKEKGLALVQTLESLLSRHRVAYRLVFVGGGPMAPELRERFPDAVFTGTLPHDEVAVAMASADVFLFPSDTDTAGNVVLEAQASGLPVLVSTVGGPRENMRHAVTGYVCRAGDPLDFCWRLTELLANAARRRETSEAARRFACTRSWHEALRPVYATYLAASRAQALSRDLGPGRAASLPATHPGL